MPKRAHTNDAHGTQTLAHTLFRPIFASLNTENPDK